MRLRLGTLVCAVLASACGRPPAGEDDVGIETSTSETSTTSSSGTSTSETTWDTDDDDDSPTNTEARPDCGGFELETAVTLSLMLVVDTSSSMVLETWDDDDDPMTPEVTRWSTAHALVELLLDGIGDSMHEGLQRFPSAAACPAATLESSNCTDADACLLAGEPEVMLGLDQGADILAMLPGVDADAIEIVGGSPASAAIVAARNHLVDQRDGTFDAIVLVTDGEANCRAGLSLPESFETYDDTLVTTVSETLQFLTIPTLVVGVDVAMTASVAGEDSPQQDDAFAALNQVAVAGGASWQMGMDPQKFYDARQPEEVLAALSAILAEHTDCIVDLNRVEGGPPPPQLIPYVSLESDGDYIPYVEDCETESGWTWIVEGEVLSFCGSWCESFAGGASVDGDYPCVGE